MARKHPKVPLAKRWPELPPDKDPDEAEWNGAVDTQEKPTSKRTAELGPGLVKEPGSKAGGSFLVFQVNHLAAEPGLGVQDHGATAREPYGSGPLSFL